MVIMSVNVGLLEKLRWRLKTIEHKVLQYRLSTNEHVITETEYGKVKGVKRMTVYDDSYFSFEGIPYAHPPVGELRFKAPQRPAPWEGVKDCTNTKDKAVQVNFMYNKVEGSEDCLYLNVYTNSLNPETPRPVMVWIHGGGFVFGEASRDFYGPDYFMKKNIVLVTIQYRLGALGFLSLKSSELNVPGNAGLKDQVMALKWVKHNCAKFGGNPDNITIFGESAGGASAHYMMLTEQTQGLFHRAILMSGNAFCPWAQTSCQHRALKLAQLAGYKGEENEKDILEFLQHAKAKDLIRLEEKVIPPEDYKSQFTFAFCPTVEPYPSPDCVIPKPPREMARHAWTNSIPILMGNTSDEGLFWNLFLKHEPALVKILDTCVEFVPDELVGADPSSPEVKELGMKLKKAFVTGETPTADNFKDIYGYSAFWFPSHRLLLSRFSHTAGGPIYLYRFDFDSEAIINPYRVFPGRGARGACHGDDVTYLFWTVLGHRLHKESREYHTIERMVGIWTQFATNGRPYNADINGMATLTWDPVKKSDRVYKCLNISDDLKIIDLPEMDKIRVWESLFDHHKEKL